MNMTQKNATDHFVNNDSLLINNMPAPTWHKLKVNGAELKINNENLSSTNASNEDDIVDEDSNVEFELHCVELTENSAFDEALKNCKTFSLPRKDNVRAVEAAAIGKTDAKDLDYPALSEYQKQTVLQEIDGTPTAFFQTGAGHAVENFMRHAFSPNLSFITTTEKSFLTIYMKPMSDFENCICVDLIARKNSNCEVTVIYVDGNNIAGTTETCSTEKTTNEETGSVNNSVNARTNVNSKPAKSIIGCNLRVFASSHSHVKVNVIQALTQNVTVLDNSGYSLCEESRVEVEQRVLGGAQTYTGLAADLHGNNSNINVSTKYIGKNEQVHDFNYSIKQRGRNTSSNLDANGILAGKAHKTLRGTIDFVHGCKGSVGNERESVLLASDNAQADTNLSNVACENEKSREDKITCKTVPVILCDEEDVSGNHGATIGHVKPETRFYLNARGLDDTDIEKLFLSSFIEDARVTFSDNESALAQIEAFAKR